MTDSLENWLATHGFERFNEKFAEQEIDLDTLSQITEDHLREMAIPIGPRLKLMRAIKSLQAGSDSISVEPQPNLVAFPRRPGRPQSQEAVESGLPTSTDQQDASGKLQPGSCMKPAMVTCLVASTTSAYPCWNAR